MHLRCEKCGNLAYPATQHMHGTDSVLCYTCAEKLLVGIKQAGRIIFTRKHASHGAYTQRRMKVNKA